jgi:6-pyruvoyltetrahydropterin/6-carboxytetrahydropterin synthase
MFTIGKEFRFEAAHHLEGLTQGHPCARTHGHSYRVLVELAADELDPAGFVVDFGLLKPLGTYLTETLDHQDLNAVLDFQPSSELLARHLYEWCGEHLPAGDRVVAVRVSETAKTWAEYRPGGRHG